MATYVIGDIHGHISMLKKLLDKINFGKNSEDDFIFIGDYADFGETAEANVDTLLFMMDLSKASNVCCLVGNHDLMCLNQLLNPETFDTNWLVRNGGIDTLRGILNHSDEMVSDIIEWLDHLPFRFDVELEDGRTFAMSHACVHPFPDIDKITRAEWEKLRENSVWDRDYVALNDMYKAEQLLGGENRTEIAVNRMLAELGTDYIVFGHTITEHFFHDGKSPFKIERLCGGKLIAIDCGAKIAGHDFFDGYERARLAAIRLEDGAEFYV